MNLVSLHQVVMAFGGAPLLDGVNLQIESGERICLLGRNGAGKSTLLRLLGGEISVDSGDIIRRQGVKIAYVPQDFPGDWAGNGDNWLQQQAGIAGLDEVTARIRTQQLCSRFDLCLSEDVAGLSGGQQRRLLLAAALLTEPDLLLLDEPTNHLDISAITELEELLLRLRATLVFVSHDRAFIRRLATRIVELDRGQLYDYRCDYSTFMERREQVQQTLDKEQQRFDRKLAEEETWIRQGIKARRTRNMGRVRQLLQLRLERRQRRERSGQVRMQIDSARRSGELIFESEQMTFCYGDGAPLVDRLDLLIKRGDRIGLIGPNGCGKTTLLKLLTGELQPTGGTIRRGTHLDIAYFDQLRDQLDGDRSVKENLAGDQDQVLVGGKPRHIYGYLQDFLFTPDRARTPVRILSGGEKNRLLLARLFLRPANLLIFDEPTNDLDLETLELLEELILDFKGTVLLVSHDRSFLDNVVTSSLVFRGDGEIDEVIGGYDEWLATRLTIPEAAARPATAPSEPRKERPRKRTFKEKRELEELPHRIETLETEQATLHQQLADPELYKGGGEQVTRMQQRLQQIEGELEDALIRWEELEALPE